MCNDCKQKKETRVSAFVPYAPVCHSCEKARARKSIARGDAIRAMDANAWPVDGWPKEG